MISVVCMHIGRLALVRANGNLALRLNLK